jgi:catechol 2,3-dioxygenase-like lactoylglutathione lyase family enzyme
MRMDVNTADAAAVQGRLLGVDHVAITVADVDATCAFYQRLFGAAVVRDHQREGRTTVRAIHVGGGVQLSVHQAGNGVELVARRPTPGSADLCFRWAGTIDEAEGLLRRHAVTIIDGPSPRQTSDGRASQSVYFLDPDGNLIELMAAD